MAGSTEESKINEATSPIYNTTGEGDPPAYNAIADPPPTYDSIFGELKQVRNESSGTLDFLKKFVIFIISTIGFTVCLALLLALPIASIYMGVTYKEKCTAQRYIPIYLIVLGAFGLLRNLIGLFNQIKKKMTDDNCEEETDRKKGACEGIIDCFLLAWFIAGNVWIYRIYEPSYDPNNPEYCDRTLYLFAFWLTTTSYIVVGFICCCMCCVACCSAMMGD